MRKKYIFLLVLSLIEISSLLSQNSFCVKLRLENIRFDSLRIATVDSTRSLVICKGHSEDKKNWEFEIPKNVWNCLDRIVFGNANYKERKYEYLRLIYPSFGDSKNTLVYASEDDPYFVPDWDNINLEAFYIQSDTVKVLEDNLILIYHSFRITPPKMSGMEAWTKCPEFSRFSEPISNNKTTSYDEYFTRYKQLVNEYPNSRLLLIKLYENYNKYHFINDARVLFNLFSDKCRNSFWGNEIKKRLSQDWTKFENISLSNIRNNCQESIVTGNKYTLVVFSASWCVYCRKEIPVLKDIWNNMVGKSFDMVTITLDDNNSINTFKNQMQQDSVGWRILSAFPLQNELSMKYTPNGIPVSLLVFPDKHIEYMEIKRNL
jgi:thioredoxin-related protein